MSREFFFGFLRKDQLFSLHWLAVQQLTKTLICQKYIPFYSKLNAELHKVTASFPKQQKTGLFHHMVICCYLNDLNSKYFSVASLVSLTLSSRPVFWILEKRPVISLYWFAVQQQNSTLRRQKYVFSYLESSAQLDEVSPSLPNNRKWLKITKS